VASSAARIGEMSWTSGLLGPAVLERDGLNMVRRGTASRLNSSRRERSLVDLSYCLAESLSLL
jgi:hypothetical protein